MSHRTISTENAPGAIGPYSQGCIGGKLLFVSGQLPIDPVSGAMIDSDIAAATKRCMDNLLAIVQAGHPSAHLVKVNIFLTNMADFTSVNEVYAGYFKDEAPARACVEVSRLPKGAPIEIEGVAVLPE